MNYEEYQERVLGRASHRWHNDKLDIEDFRETLTNFIEWGNRLDRIKKALMYGREFAWDVGYEGSPNDALPVETPVPTPSLKHQQLIHAMLGAATEGVEMIEQVYEFFRQYTDDNVLDYVNVQEEFGDMEWYRAFALRTLGQSDEQNRIQNDAKLEKRFGPGQVFSEEAANNRDLDAERQILDDHNS